MANSQLPALKKNDGVVRYGTQSYLGHNGHYSGRFESAVKEGRGTATTPLFTYMGYWRANLPQGVGRCQYYTGEVYEGSWVDGLPRILGFPLSPLLTT